MISPSDRLRDIWLDAALPIVGETGWHKNRLHEIGLKTSLSAGEMALAAPNGVVDLIDHFLDRLTSRARAEAAAMDMSHLRTHEKVAAALRVWFKQAEADKSAIAAAVRYGVSPKGLAPASQRLWAIADYAWGATGDTSTDYNKFTKRGLLSAALPAIFRFWFENQDEAALAVEIDSRLQQAMRLGQSGGKLVKALTSLKPPF